MSDSLHIVCPHCDGVNRVPVSRLGDGARCGKCQSALFAGQPLSLNEQRFTQHVGRSGIPVLVDFWAPWCGPCRAMAPAFEQAAQQLEPQVRLVKVNTEEAQGLAMRHGIRSIPTLALFRDGQEIDRIAGALNLQSLISWARQHL